MGISEKKGAMEEGRGVERGVWLVSVLCFLPYSLALEDVEVVYMNPLFLCL